MSRPTKSPPLASFLRSLGKVQHHLHTAVVGLSAVERRVATKPDDLDITWKPNDPVNSAREARQFVLRAALIFLAEELKEYATRILKYRAIASAETFAPPSDLADRIRALVKSVVLEPRYLIIAPLIACHWRNRIVHRSSNAQLDAAEKQILLDSAEAVSKGYKGIDVGRLLADSEANRPTLKDVTVVLAMSIRFVECVDSFLPPIDSARKVREWLEAEGVLTGVLKLEKQTANQGEPNARRRARQYLLTIAPGLADSYYEHGAAEPE